MRNRKPPPLNQNLHRLVRQSLLPRGPLHYNNVRLNLSGLRSNAPRQHLPLTRLAPPIYSVHRPEVIPSATPPQAMPASEHQLKPIHSAARHMVPRQQCPTRQQLADPT